MIAAIVIGAVLLFIGWYVWQLLNCFDGGI